MDDSIRTAKYDPLDITYARCCLICGEADVKPQFKTSVIVDTKNVWLCDRCRKGLLKLIDDANTSNALDALDCVEERKKSEWDMFDLISSAYYGKGMYFKQDNGTVYSRHSGEYMTVDEAIREFISLIDI